MTDKAVFLHTPALDEGGYPAGCPFDTSRAGRAREIVRSMGLLSGSEREERAPEPLDRATLERFHLPRYLEALQRGGRGELHPDQALIAGLGTSECPIFAGMYDYACLAAGGSVTGARLLLQDKARTVFNPSGGFHHAHPDHAAGFCYLNDVVLAAMLLAEAGKRVCFLDIDVHHCDGVQDAFYKRSDIMTLSMHESGKTLFPGTGFEDEIGEGEGRGYAVNVPLPVGTHDAAYLGAFREVVFPLMDAYDPDMVIIELGMDALAGDPMAHLRLTNNTHADILGRVLDMGKPVLATGGGGYNVENTVRGWALSWSVLCGEQQGYDDLMIGMGGVMLQTTEWSGGLRDRDLPPDGNRRAEIDREIDAVKQRLREILFPLHAV